MLSLMLKGKNNGLYKAPKRGDDYEPGGWTMYDDVGWPVSGERSPSFIKRAVKAVVWKIKYGGLDDMHEEIKRLDALWKKEMSG